MKAAFQTPSIPSGTVVTVSVTVFSCTIVAPPWPPDRASGSASVSSVEICAELKSSKEIEEPLSLARTITTLKPEAYATFP